MSEEERESHDSVKCNRPNCPNGGGLAFFCLESDDLKRALSWKAGKQEDK